MNKIAVITACILLAISATAQNKKADSLKNIIAHYPTKADSNLAKLYNLLYIEWSKNDPDSAVYYTSKALDIAEKIDYKPAIAASYNNLGWTNINTGKIIKGYEYYLESLKFYTELNDREGLVQVYNGLGVTFGMQDKYEESLRFFLKALAINEQSKSTAGLISSYLKIGVLFTRSNDDEKALVYLNKALDLATKTGDKRDASSIYYNIASIYGKQKLLDKCLSASLKAKELAEEIHSETGLAIASINLGKVYTELGNYKEAERYLKLGTTYFIHLKNPEQTAQAYNGLATLYNYKKQPALSKKYFDSSNAIAKELNDAGLLYDNYQSIAEIYIEEGNYKMASVYYQKILVLKDSLFNSDKINSLDHLKSSYELEKKQLTIQELKKDNYTKTQQRNYLAIAIGVGFILMLLLVSTILYIRKKNKILLEKKKELRNLNKLKDKFFSIIGHDLRAPIANIQGVLNLISQPQLLTEEEKGVLIENLKTGTASALETMNNMVAWGKHQIQNATFAATDVNIADTLHRVHRFLKQTADHKKISINIRIDEPAYVFVNKDQLEFVCRNLISNAIKFSFADSNIDIWCRRSGNSVSLYVKDHGTGMTEDTKSKLFDKSNWNSVRGTSGEIGSGLGLLLCKQFIEENKGAIMVTSELEKGTMFSIELPASQITEKLKQSA